MKKLSYIGIPEEEAREESGDEVITALHGAADTFIHQILKHPESLDGEFSEDLGALIWSSPIVRGGISCQLRQDWGSRVIFVYTEGFGDSVVAVPYETQQSALYALVRQLPQEQTSKA